MTCNFQWNFSCFFHLLVFRSNKMYISAVSLNCCSALLGDRSVLLIFSIFLSVFAVNLCELTFLLCFLNVVLLCFVDMNSSSHSSRSSCGAGASTYFILQYQKAFPAVQLRCVFYYQDITGSSTMMSHLPQSVHIVHFSQ